MAAIDDFLGGGEGVPDEDIMTPARAEVLTLLTEECAEVIQRVTKHNRETLEAELGDVLAVLALAHKYGLVRIAQVSAHANVKLNAFRANDGRLRHADADQLHVAALTILPPVEKP